MATRDTPNFSTAATSDQKSDDESYYSYLEISDNLTEEKQDPNGTIKCILPHRKGIRKTERKAHFNRVLAVLKGITKTERKAHLNRILAKIFAINKYRSDI